jgi:hypothetical protein
MDVTIRPEPALACLVEAISASGKPDQPDSTLLIRASL